jgi:hypothetical protein
VATRPVAIFVPPASLRNEDAVFNLPVIADVGQQLIGANFACIEAGQEVARVVQTHGAVVGTDVAIDAERSGSQGNSTARGYSRRCLDQATTDGVPFFSIV